MDFQCDEDFDLDTYCGLPHHHHHQHHHHNQHPHHHNHSCNQRRNQENDDEPCYCHPKRPSKHLKVLVGVTASVATIKLGELVDKLYSIPAVQEIAVVPTEKSEKFFNSDEIISIGGNHEKAEVKIWRDEDEWSMWNGRGDPVLHIDLGKWADAMIIAPLDANSLAKIATGLCDNLLTCVLRAWDLKNVKKKPVFFCPAMNTKMWEHPITAQQIQALCNFGYTCIPPIEKTLMCGDKGVGAMATVDTIVNTFRSRMNKICNCDGSGSAEDSFSSGSNATQFYDSKSFSSNDNRRPSGNCESVFQTYGNCPEVICEDEDELQEQEDQHGNMQNQNQQQRQANQQQGRKMSGGASKGNWVIPPGGESNQTSLGSYSHGGSPAPRNPQGKPEYSANSSDFDSVTLNSSTKSSGRGGSNQNSAVSYSRSPSKIPSGPASPNSRPNYTASTSSAGGTSKIPSSTPIGSQYVKPNMSSPGSSVLNQVGNNRSNVNSSGSKSGSAPPSTKSPTVGPSLGSSGKGTTSGSTPTGTGTESGSTLLRINVVQESETGTSAPTITTASSVSPSSGTDTGSTLLKVNVVQESDTGTSATTTTTGTGLSGSSVPSSNDTDSGSTLLRINVVPESDPSELAETTANTSGGSTQTNTNSGSTLLRLNVVQESDPSELAETTANSSSGGSTQPSTNSGSTLLKLKVVEESDVSVEETRSEQYNDESLDDADLAE